MTGCSDTSALRSGTSDNGNGFLNLAMETGKLGHRKVSHPSHTPVAG
jgi:hypothetical protein